MTMALAALLKVSANDYVSMQITTGGAVIFFFSAAIFEFKASKLFELGGDNFQLDLIYLTNNEIDQLWWKTSIFNSSK